MAAPEFDFTKMQAPTQAKVPTVPPAPEFDFTKVQEPPKKIAAAPAAPEFDFTKVVVPTAPAVKTPAPATPETVVPDDSPDRSNILPYNKKLGWHWPAMALGIGDALKAPGDVTGGKLNNTSLDAMNKRAFDTAMLLAGTGGAPKAIKGALPKAAAEEMPVMPGAIQDPSGALHIIGADGKLQQVGWGVKKAPAPPPIETPDNIAARVAREGLAASASEKDTRPPLVGIKPEVVREDTALTRSQDFAKAARNIFSPTSAGPNAKLAETAVRDYEGTGLRNRAMAEQRLEHYAQMGQKIADDPVAQGQFFDYVQGRTKGAKLADPAMEPLANEIKTLAMDTEKQLRELPQTEDMSFITDYFPQMWKDPERAASFAQSFTGKQGRTGFTKARKYPTIADGLKAGLELADPNPANAMLNYVTNTQKYISAAKIFNEGRELGLIKYAPPGAKVPEGWLPLKGRLAGENSPGRMVHSEEAGSTYIPPKQAYAPADYALIYNNYLSSGFEKTQAADIYHAVRGLKNAQTRLQLGFSTHHFATIMAQNMAENVARTIKNAALGDIKGAAGAAKDLVSSPLPGISKTYRAGKKLQAQYMGAKDYGPAMEERAKLFASAGGRVGEDPLYKGSTQKSLIESAKNGTLWDEMRAGADTAVRTKGFSTPMQAVRIAGRLADTVAAPLFEKYIPRMKLGAFDANMSDWLRQNPNADAGEIRVAAKHIMDLMDERYGEIADSNVFWDRTTKQVLGTMFRAPNWNLGLVRQSFGGLLDAGKATSQLVRGKGVDAKLLDRPSYLLGYALLLAGANTAMGYMKTGEMPEGWKDLVTYKTGGTTKFGNATIPERAIFPGHPKEVLHMLPDPGGSATSGMAHLLNNKWSSLVSNGMQAYNNENWQGKDMHWSYPERAAHVLLEPFAPLQIETMLKGQSAGSNISSLERFMNVNAAPATVTAPDKIRRLNQNKNQKAEKTKKKIKQREAARYPDAGF